jgi:hypothetical protein
MSSVDAVAIIGRDNDPLYFKTYNIHNNGEDLPSSLSSTNVDQSNKNSNVVNSNTTDLMEPDPDLYLRLLVYSALDIIEERSRGLAEKNVYLGQLHTGDQRKVYGFVTTTSIKFMVAITDEGGNDGNGVLQDPTMRTFFRSIHGLFVDTLSNPFSQTTQSSTSSARDACFVPSAKFEASVKKVTDDLEAALKK